MVALYLARADAVASGCVDPTASGWVPLTRVASRHQPLRRRATGALAATEQRLATRHAVDEARVVYSTVAPTFSILTDVPVASFSTTVCMFTNSRIPNSDSS